MDVIDYENGITGWLNTVGVGFIEPIPAPYDSPSNICAKYTAPIGSNRIQTRSYWTIDEGQYTHVGFRTFVPEDVNLGTGWILAVQWHQNTIAKQPPVALFIKDGVWQVETPLGSVKVHKFTPVEKGKWVYWAFSIKRATKLGSVVVYKDKKNVLDIMCPTAYTSIATAPLRMEAGVYRTGGLTDRPQSICYDKFVRVNSLQELLSEQDPCKPIKDQIALLTMDKAQIEADIVKLQADLNQCMNGVY